MAVNNHDAIKIIKDSTYNLIPESRILLFGSRARMEGSEESDYDFLIITRDSIDIQTKRNYKSMLRKKLAKHKIPADILIQSEDEIQNKKEITGHIIKSILKEGIDL
ncbi:MAG: nucleotidyltransferase domain-containing protein [Tangfeifania sp.]